LKILLIKTIFLGINKLEQKHAFKEKSSKQGNHLNYKEKYMLSRNQQASITICLKDLKKQNNRCM